MLLLGGGELQDTIKSKVEKLNLCDSVIFCGVRTDVNKYLYNDKETIGQVQKHARNAFLDVVTCKYLPAVRKAEIALFCFNFSAYRFIYIKYKSKKKIA